MLPSLRPLIAEGMRAMADAKIKQYPGGWQPFMEAELTRLEHGAQTLEWCDANDPEVTDEADDRVVELASALSDIRAALVAWDTSTNAKRHEALKQELAEILLEVGL